MATPSSRTRLSWWLAFARRSGFVWAAAAVSLLIGTIGLDQHREAEVIIGRLSEAHQAVAGMRGHVASGFLALSTTEGDPAERGVQAARLALMEGLGDLQTANASLAALPDAAASRADLDRIGAQIGRLIAEDLRTLADDRRIAASYARLDEQLQALADGMRRLEQGELAALDRFANRSALTFLALSLLLVAMALAQTVRHRRAEVRQSVAEAHARFQAQLVQTITESTTDAVCMKDRQGRYVYLNAAAQRQLGAPRRDALGRTAHDLLDAPAAGRITALDARVMTGRVSETVEERVTLNGVERTWLVTKVPTLDDYGEVTGLLEISRDITARKAEEDALRDSEARLTLALRAARMGVWRLDLPTEAVTWSTEVREITGMASPFRNREEFERMLAADDRARVLAAIERAIVERVPFQETFGFLSTPNAPRRLTLFGEARYDDAGLPVSVTGVVMDVTERARMEHALRESESQYRHFLDALPDAVFLNEGDIVTYCNDAYLALRGARDPADVIGRPVWEMFPAEDRDRVRERIAYVRSTGLSAPPEERHVRRLDGRLVPVLASGVHVTRYTAGSILVVLRDLSRERQVAAWSSAILDHARDGIVTTNADGIVLAVNRAAERMFGHASQALIGRHVRELVPSAVSGDVNQRVETTALRADGTSFPIDAAISAFELDGEIHVIAVIRDITDRRTLESELRQSHKMEALGQVAGGVAHDFNNLLTVILGYAEILQDQLPASDPRRQFANDIRRASGRAADLTRQLLAFSRRTVVTPKVLDLNTVVADMNRMLRRVLGEDVQLITELHPTERRIFMDAGSLEQVVMNLAINARDAMPSGGRLTVATRVQPSPGGVDATGAHFEARDYLLLTVTDTGTGIPEAVRSRIFEPFFTTKDPGHGTGLGLAVVQSIVRQNGGFIGLESAPGGTTFTIGLPAVIEADVTAEPAPVPARGHGETVLVVEDEEPVRRLATITLTRAGYQVLEAENMAAALEVFDRAGASVDVVVTDVVMPQGGGRALADALTARRPGLPILFTSGYADDATLRHGISRQEVPFLPKPYAPPALLELVRRLLDQARADPPGR